MIKKQLWFTTFRLKLAKDFYYLFTSIAQAFTMLEGVTRVVARIPMSAVAIIVEY